ncbi:MAG TPA: GNAT family N-acetyltransferase [Thermomicrobiales bacterium]|jgi:ribosomal protein S18 acetylase RimI-like enzyme
MRARIRPFAHADSEAVVRLSLLAWAPVFASFQEVLGPRIYARLYPDWQTQQRDVVEKALADANTVTLVAEVAGVVAGFIAFILDQQEKTGEVWLLAVHPDYQGHGIGTALNEWVVERMRESGMTLAVVGTGGDPGHAPARRSYEKAGYTAFPQVRYFKAL